MNTNEGKFTQFEQRKTWLAVIHRFYHSFPIASPITILLCAVLVFWVIVGNRFISPFNLSIIIQQVTVIGIIAVAQTLVILTAGIDLSVGAIMVFCSVVMGRLAVIVQIPVALAFFVGLAVGTLCGMINGILITKFKMPPFIVTLGTWNIFFALNLFYSKSESIRSQDIEAIAPWLQTLGRPIDFFSASITYGVLFMLALFILMRYVLTYTTFGRHVVATGSNINAAGLVGIKTDRVIISVYALSGFICACGGWALIGRIGSVSPQAGVTANIESITAVVIGGISLFGGRGQIMGALIGALTVGIFRNFLALKGVDVLWQLFAVGVLIIASLAVDQWIRRSSSNG